MDTKNKLIKTDNKILLKFDKNKKINNIEKLIVKSEFDGIIIDKNKKYKYSKIFIKKKIRFNIRFLIFYYLIINLITQIVSNNKIHYFDSKIIIKVNKTGNIKIFFKLLINEPNEIYVNGINQTNIKYDSYYYKYNFTSNEKENEIILIWNKNINTAGEMFYGCGITGIDFSYFNTSLVTSMHEMFEDCSSLISLNLSNFDTSKVTDMGRMFSGCSSLSSLDLLNFDTSNVQYMYDMFWGCSSLSSLNLSNFNTLKVIDMQRMFYGCTKLNCLDLSNFNTINVIHMDYMFYNCLSLSPLNLSNFNTINVIYMNYMFYNCSSLSSLNLSNFNTSTVFYMDYMFYGCSSLSMLDISNFNTSKVVYMLDMFYGCSSLNSLNIFNLDDSRALYMYKMLSNCSYTEYMNFQINKSEKYKIVELTPSYSLICKNEVEFQKLFWELEYFSYNYYYYKYYNYDEAIFENYNYQNRCEIMGEEINKKYNYKYIYCYYSKEVIFPSDNIINDTIINKTEIVSQKKQEIINNCNISDIKNGRDVESKVDGNDNDEIIMAFTSTKNQKNNENENKTTINLGECEYKLKDLYNISYNDSLYIVKLDVKQKGMDIPKIEYEVYYPLYNKELILLNLSICKNIKIDLTIPVSIDDDLDKHDPNSDYYKDICLKSSDNGIDISLNERKNIFVNENMTLCEDGCNLAHYNYTTKKAKCSCEVKIKLPLIEEIRFDKNKLYQNFIDIKNIANIKLLKCYKEVLNGKSLKKNYGFYILVLIIIFYFICLILFYSKYYFSLIKIIKIITKSKKKLIKVETQIPVETEKENNDIDNKIKVKRNGKKNKEKKKSINIELNSPKKSIKELNLKESFPPRKRKILSKKSVTENNLKILMSMSNSKLELNKNKNKKFVKYQEILNYNDIELNSLNYHEALKYDKRTYLQYYISLLKIKNLIFFSFYCQKKDYNSQIIKIFLFFYFFAIHFAVNALFFNDSTMHKIYEDEGDYNFIYQIPQILYSSIISGVINGLIKYLSLSEGNIISIKSEKTIQSLHLKKLKIIRVLKVKFALFFMITIFILFFVLYYVTCFCGIYVNTQLHLIKDTLTSFGLSFIYPFGINLIPGIFRIPALKSRNQKNLYLYNASKLIQLI